MSTMRFFLMTLAVMGLAACASVAYPQRLQQRQQAYEAAADAPVRSFRLLFNGIYSWEPLSTTQLVIYTQPNKAYLLDVWPCNNLIFTNGIGLTSFASQVQTGFDKVFTGRGYVPCMIKQIRPVNLVQFKLERESQRHVDSLQRDSGNPAPASSTGGGSG